MLQVERLDGLHHLRIPAGQRYKSKGHIFVEGDASSASYWLAGKDTLARAASEAFAAIYWGYRHLTKPLRQAHSRLA